VSDPGGPSGADPEVPEVRRDATRAAAEKARRRKLVVVVAAVVLAVVVAGAVVFALTRGEEPVASSTTTTTTTSTTTTTAVPTGPIAPLTGVLVPDTDTEAVQRLNRPALVAKIDNAPAAMPQIGLDRADVVIELRVEGISRFMGVVHSQQVDELGPIRSARTSDPDLLAMFVRPLVAWSGGNPTVTRTMNSTPWIQSLNPDQTTGAYSRTRTKRAPHNLVADVPRLYSYADEPPAVPSPLFEYLEAGVDPGGVPVPGVSIAVGDSPSTFLWDVERGRWLRWSSGAPQTVTGGDQVSATNVVVLATPYTTSSADRLSPEAQTLGTGTAWVFTQGQLVEGRWDRSDRAQPWRLTGLGGRPIPLTPGVTWVALPSPASPPSVLSAEAAQQLAAG
jgi:hypothetical protein